MPIQNKSKWNKIIINKNGKGRASGHVYTVERELNINWQKHEILNRNIFPKLFLFAYNIIGRFCRTERGTGSVGGGGVRRLHILPQLHS